MFTAAFSVHFLAERIELQRNAAGHALSSHSKWKTASHILGKCDSPLQSFPPHQFHDLLLPAPNNVQIMYCDEVQQDS